MRITEKKRLLKNLMEKKDLKHHSLIFWEKPLSDLENSEILNFVKYNVLRAAISMNKNCTKDFIKTIDSSCSSFICANFRLFANRTPLELHYYVDCGIAGKYGVNYSFSMQVFGMWFSEGIKQSL